MDALKIMFLNPVGHDAYDQLFADMIKAHKKSQHRSPCDFTESVFRGDYKPGISYV